ncbi:MAG: hypothetical protein WC758_07945 [Candidatus Woesearchaeota archaeon]|jgi:hypothetical protein
MDEINNLLKERPKDPELKSCGDGKVELSVNMNKQTQKRLDELVKIRKKDEGEVIEEAVEDYTARVEAIDFTELDGSFELFDIPKNDRLKNFQILSKLIENKRKTCEEDLYLGTEEQKEYSKVYLKTYNWVVKPVLENFKLFELDDEVIPMLKLHDQEDGTFPFPSIAIDCQVAFNRNNKERIYLGFLLGSYYFTKEEEHQNYRLVNTCYAEKDKNGEYHLQQDIIALDLNETTSKLYHSNPYHKEIRKFIFAFLNFINSPEVKFVETQLNPKNNERRKERGRMPLPVSKRIYIHGMQLRNYINEINFGVKRIGYNHKFWVRGCYFHLRNREKFKRLYALTENELKSKGYELFNGTIRKWKNAFIKGNGLLIDKVYKVKK